MRRVQFERAVARAVAAIPEAFRAKVVNLAFLVEEWADEEILAEVGFEDPRDLLGYYSGWPLTERTHEYGNCPPDVIIIYQGAVENHAAETGLSLGRVLRETVMHELAHYFGFSEEEMDEIEELWARDGEQ